MLRQSGRAAFAALICCIFLMMSVPAFAQSGALVAFVNNSGQLIVNSADGSYRWIVTNPDETLVPQIGYTWSPSGNQLFFAVNVYGAISLRFANPGSQAVYEAAQISGGTLSGGAWTPDGRGVVFSDGNTIRLLGTDSSLTDLVSGQAGARVFSPYGDSRPNLPGTEVLSADGRYLFYQQGDGRYAVAALDGSSAFPLPGSNDANVRESGLWSSAAPLVAYWGYEGNSILSVTNAANGQTVTLDSGRATPITPILWRPNSTQLLYRDASGYVRAADMSCLSGGCAANPLEAGVEALPPTAMEITTDGASLYYQDGYNLMAVSMSCIDSASCAGSAVMLAGNAAPGMMVSVGGPMLAYTGFAASANDANDRLAQFVQLNGCQASGGCVAMSAGPGMTGLVAGGGSAAVVDIPGSGLQAINLASGTAAYLSDSPGMAGLVGARWNS
ncbi:MAG: hypothetical protein IAE89_14530 [Anaerolineae bacterium]|nr:hypothetical protein [Anaerolineae bacterium]